MIGLLKQRLSRLGTGTDLCFAIVYPDGSTQQNRPGDPSVRLVVKTPRVALRVLLFGHVGLLESYFTGELDVDGEFARAFQAAFDGGYDRNATPWVALRNRWHELRHSNQTKDQAKRNACFHYDLGEPFYRQWLDRALLMYTCAYWKEGCETIEQAQRAKVEHVCRKIRLQPDEHVHDIGCGFGGFMFHAAERHGARVTGVNTATGQVEWVRGEIARRGLGERVNVHEADFRDVHGTFDKVVSIGVLEHAGRDQLEAVVRAHAEPLRPGGLGMLHFIGHLGDHETEFFIRHHVFPGGWIPSLARTLEAMERCGLEILDIENLRRHYALTLDAWAHRFDASWPQIRALDPDTFDERFRRTWRAYLYSCAEMFRSSSGYTYLFQIVFSKGNVAPRAYPMSRAFLYNDAGALPEVDSVEVAPARSWAARG